MTAPLPPYVTPKPAPTLAEVRAWLGVSADLISDQKLETLRLQELANQARECRIPAAMTAAGQLPPDLVGSLYRRVARALAALGVPLGYVSGNDEFGPLRVTSYDAEITRIEGPIRKFVFG